MMDLTDTAAWDPTLTLLWGLHVLSVVASFAGVVLLIVLAAKTCTGRQLMYWGIGLIAAGIVACLITIAVRGTPWGLFPDRAGKMMRMQMMEERMEDMMERRGGNSTSPMTEGAKQRDS